MSSFKVFLPLNGMPTGDLNPLPRSPTKTLGEIGNIQVVKEDISKATIRDTAVGGSAEVEMENDESNGCLKSYDEVKTAIDNVLFTKICELIHHDKGSDTADDLADEIVEKLDSEFYPDETVRMKVDGQSKRVQIVSFEKRGGARFCYVKLDGVKLPDKVNGINLRRLYNPKESEVKLIVNAVATKEHGKPWQVNEDIRKEHGIKDKFASIFCTTPKSKNPSVPAATGRVADSSSEDDTPLETLRRSAAGLPPSATRKHVEKKQKEIVKKEKVSSKATVKKEKVEDKKEKSEGALSKFMATPGGGSVLKSSGDPNSPFLTPQKRSEKRFTNANQKLSDAWKKRDYSEFLAAATWSAKVLSMVQAEKLENELHRFAVRKIQDKTRDQETMKKMAKELRKEFRERMAESRKELYKKMESRIRSYFNEKIIVEDLSVCSDPLPCFGRPVGIAQERSPFFADCLMLTQFLSSLKKFIHCEDHITAINLLNGMFEGRIGYMKNTSKVLCALLKTLLQDEEHKKLAHFNARLREFAIEENTVSELCRAFLIASPDVDDKKSKKADGVDKEKSVEPSADSQDTDHGDDQDDDGRTTPGDTFDLDLSQMEMEERNTLLARFHSDMEVWQLAIEDQIGLLRLLFHSILDLQSFKDYINQEGLSSEAKSLKDRVGKLSDQLEGWRATLSELPEVDENIELSQLSRTQTRERAETERKREALEKKIEDAQDKVEELLDKLAVEKRSQSQSKRIVPMGEDRHFRCYFLFPSKGPDAGLWIQDMGTTSYETFIKTCVAHGKPFAPIEDASSQDENCFDVHGAQIVPDHLTESWLRITDVDSLTKLRDSLMKQGTREGSLKNFLTKHFDEITSCIVTGSKENSSTPAPAANNENGVNEEADTEVEGDVSADPLDSLKTSIVQLATDLSGSYLTSLEMEVFEAKVVSADSLTQVKECLAELVDSMPSKAIIVRFEMKEAMSSGFSHLIKDRWKQRLLEANNASAVHILRNYLDSRIDWKKSIVEKRCSKCTSRRSPEAKIECSGCNLVVHYYCTRPKLSERPASWLCPDCTRANAKKVLEENRVTRKQPKYVDTDDDDVDDEGESGGSEGEEEGEEGDDDDDYFSAKNRARASRKRVILDSDVEDDIDEKETGGRGAGRSKRQKVVSKAVEECLAVLEKVKSEHRLYRSLLTVPIRSGTRRAPSVTLESLERDIGDYASVQSFSADLHTFLTAAMAYFEEHNERKVEDLEKLMISLDIPKQSKRSR